MAKILISMAYILELDNSELWNTKKIKYLTFGGEVKAVSSNDIYNNFFNNDVMFFNKTILKKAGLWDEYNLYTMQANKTWNWDAFSQLCKKINKYKETSGDENIFPLSPWGKDLTGFAITNGDGEDSSSLVKLQSDGRVILDINNPAKRAVFDLFTSLSVSKCFLNYEIFPMDFPENSFLNGHTLFCVANGKFMYDLKDQLVDEWGIVALPMGPDSKDKTYHISSSQISGGIIKNAPNKEELAYVLKELMRPALDSSDMIPIISNELFNSNMGYDSNIAQTYELLSRPEALVNDFSQVAVAVRALFTLNQCVVSLTNDKAVVEEWINKVQKDIDFGWGMIGAR